MSYQASYETVTKQPGKPTASFVLGLIGLLAWIIPIIGLPVTITGLVFGMRALKREDVGLAIAGITLSSLGLVLSVANATLGAYLGATGRL
jgi:hypothetical protein